MKIAYMGPDGELYSSDGPDRIRTTKLNALSEEFAFFREGLYKAKMNDIVERGFMAQSQENLEFVRMCNERKRIIEEGSSKP